MNKERKLIFSVHLSKLRPDSWQSFDLAVLSEQSKNFSGAEIQQSIIEGMHIAFNENREFTTNDIQRGLKEIIPINLPGIEQWKLGEMVKYILCNETDEKNRGFSIRNQDSY